MPEAAYEGVSIPEVEGGDRERTEPEWTQASPLNPFEATFSLLMSLRDEIREVREELKELKEAKLTRFTALEERMDKHRIATDNHLTALEKAVEANTQHRDETIGRSKIDFEELRTAMNSRLAQLDAQMKAEMNIRFEQKQDLDKKIREEAANLLGMIEKLEVECGENKQKLETQSMEARHRHDELRQDVEKLAALLSDSSMTRDPFKLLGYRPAPPSSQITPLGSTAHGNNLPPLIGSTKTTDKHRS